MTLASEPLELSSEGLQGLTPRQFQFATRVFQGASAIDAYREVYGVTNENMATVAPNASRLLTNAKVQAKLKELRERVDEQTTLAPFLTREWILNGVARLAQHATKESVQLGAYKLLGQTVGIDLFRETTVVERRQRTPDEIDAELRKRLDELSVTIEGRATVKPAQAIEPDKTTDRRRKPAK